MAKSASKSPKPRTRAGNRDAEPAVHEAGHQTKGPVCTVGFCPICITITAMQPIRPDVIEHLMLAGRELLLAARAVLDSGSETGAPRPHLEKIDIA